MPAPQCIAYTHQFTRCSRRAQDGGEHCRSHRRIYDEALGGAPPNPHRCTMIMGGHRFCQNARVDGGTLCQIHVETVAAVRERLEVGEHVRRYLHVVPLRGWREVAREVFRDPLVPAHRARDVAHAYYQATANPHPLLDFVVYWNWVMGGEVGPAPDPIVPAAAPVWAPPVAPVAPAPPARGLRAFVEDGQNVHRGEVSRQTNESVKKLLAEPDTAKDVERVLAKAWHDLPAGRIPNFSRYLETAMDMNSWYYKATCREVDDYLYRKVLHGVVSLIQRQPQELRMELYARVYEEARDSVGMCCEGHIARLCNVFVGFDDAFKPPVSLGEVLQMKMSAISQQEISVEAKQAEAVRVFDEYGVPAEERVAWLEAF
jgi:hypothetical protein